MALRGQFKPPVEPIEKAFRRAIEMIEGVDVPVAIFMIAGKIVVTKSTSGSFEAKTRLLANNLVGVYDWYVDPRDVLDDIKVFYPKESMNKVHA
ncbi:hypothetical protein [Herminiimonas contaminans]|uniref:Uncharacterized protein n=1 Tax=Herminiimonas contaminans TaxID=1111140 RepID=A0ABS0EUS1_9BURK|nr:hypothetical protein [Herminiimonas contaminans]MBF8177824.1 hypothetical protein [Herminiimonas contaminans]